MFHPLIPRLTVLPATRTWKPTERRMMVSTMPQQLRMPKTPLPTFFAKWKSPCLQLKPLLHHLTLNQNLLSNAAPTRSRRPSSSRLASSANLSTKKKTHQKLLIGPSPPTNLRRPTYLSPAHQSWMTPPKCLHRTWTTHTCHGEPPARYAPHLPPDLGHLPVLQSGLVRLCPTQALSLLTLMAALGQELLRLATQAVPDVRCLHSPSFPDAQDLQTPRQARLPSTLTARTMSLDPMMTRRGPSCTV